LDLGAIMSILVTGSSGHLGEALMRTLLARGDRAIGLDLTSGPFTQQVGSIVDPACVTRCMRGVRTVLHTATLHKPHVATHSRYDFVATNITGTLNLLEEAVKAGVDTFVFTSTTSAFGGALTPARGAPATWIDETVVPTPKNIYGVTKTAAEDLCELFHRLYTLPCIVLRTSRFFPEPDDDPVVRDTYDDTNVKINELLYRRVDLEDVVSAHLHAMTYARAIGFGRYIISATTPFSRDDLLELRSNAPAVVERYVPQYRDVYCRLGWRMCPGIHRVYVNDRARRELGWQPRYDFGRAITLLENHEEPRSALARAIGAKGYHAKVFEETPYPVE
jgi:UDP-glucose 4-epimerase